MKGILIVFMLLSSMQSNSQVNWKFQAKKVADRTYKIVLSAAIDESWHIYSQSTPEDGPLPTKISFSKNPLLTFDGPVKEVGNMKIYQEEVFGVEVHAFANSVNFVQTVRLKTKARTSLTGEIEYMACSSEQCTPPMTVKFNIELE